MYMYLNLHRNACIYVCMYVLTCVSMHDVCMHTYTRTYQAINKTLKNVTKTLNVVI